MADTRRLLGFPGWKGPVYNPDELGRQKGGLRVYDQMRHDDQVKACLSYRLATILGPGWTLDPASEDPSDQEFADLVKADLLGLPGTFEDVMAQLLTAFAYGYALGEALYALTPDVHLTAVKLRAPHHIVFDQDGFGHVTGVRQLVGGTQGQPWPIEKFVHFVHQPEFDNPYGTSDLRAAYDGWFAKQFVFQCWMTWTERYADPPAMAKGPSGNAQQRDALLKILDRLQARTSFYLPQDWTAELLESHRQPREVFEATVDRCDLRIAKALLNPEKLGLVGGSVKGGSYALAQTQYNVAILLRNQDAARLEACVQEQIVNRLAAYKDAQREVPRFRLNPLAEENVELAIQAYDKLVTDGTLLPTARDEVRWREVLKLPALGDDEVQQREELLAKKREMALNPGIPTDPNAPPPNGNGGSTPPTPGQSKPGQPKDANATAQMAEGAPWRPLTPVEQRANMAEKATTLDEASNALKAVVAQHTLGLIHGLRDTITRKGLTQPDADPSDVAALTMPTGKLAGFRKAVTTELQTAYERGAENARGELARAKPTQQLATQPLGLVGTKATRYFKAKALQVTGVLSDDILAKAKQVLLNAVKGDKPARTVELELDDALGDFLPETDAAGNVVNVPARLENIARTNTADAVNEARFAVFTDPDPPDGFVSALVYSPILDERTRAAHAAWDGVAKPVEWWQGPPDRRPPNGFQCRCTLVPSVGDETDITPDDELPNTPNFPDPGFK